MVKFLHVADLHMDRSFESILTSTTNFSEALKQANQQTLATIAELAVDQHVDFVLLAGDTFHQSTSTMRSQAALQAFFQQLAAEHIPVFMNFGNHDYYQSQRFWYSFPENVHLFKTEQVETIAFVTKQGERIQLSSFSYVDRWLNAAKAKEFPVKDAAVCDYHIGLYHGEQASLNEQATQQYAPFSLGDLQAKHYDYWAMGHIHAPHVLDDGGRIIYAGTPQGHNRKESTVKGVVLVELSPVDCQYQWMPVAQVAYQTMLIDLKEAETLPAAYERIVRQLKKQRSAEVTPLLVVTLQLKNSGDFQTELQAKIASEEFAEELLRQLADERLAFSKIMVDVSATREETKRVVLPLTSKQAENIIQQITDDDHFQQLIAPLRAHKWMRDLPIFDSECQADVRQLTTEIVQESITFGGTADEDY